MNKIKSGVIRYIIQYGVCFTAARFVPAHVRILFAVGGRPSTLPAKTPSPFSAPSSLLSYNACMPTQIPKKGFSRVARNKFVTKTTAADFFHA